MKALKYMGPGQLELTDVALPKPKEGEVLLKVKACGICGSDVHGYLGLTGRRIPPVTMGHEFSAEVVETADEDSGLRPGDGVIAQPIHFCGYCANCKKGLTNMCLNKDFFGVLSTDGAMAEYLCVPEKLLYRLPEGCTYEEGALCEPYAVAYGSIKKAGSLDGKNVLIVGAGTIGMCILQLVLIQNPKRIMVSDLSEVRLARTRTLAALAGKEDIIYSIDPGKFDYMEEIKRITDGEMVDLSIEAVGVESTANQSIKSLAVGGTAVWVGMSQKEMTINMQDIVCSARSVLGSFNYTHEEFGEVVDLLGKKKLNSSLLISKTVSLDEAAQAFADLHDKPDDYLKIIIEP